MRSTARDVSTRLALHREVLSTLIRHVETQGNQWRPIIADLPNARAVYRDFAAREAPRGGPESAVACRARHR